MNEKQEKRQAKIEELQEVARTRLATGIRYWKSCRARGDDSEARRYAGVVTGLRMALADPRPERTYIREASTTRAALNQFATKVNCALKLLNTNDIQNSYAVWFTTPVFNVGPKRLREFMAAWQRDQNRFADHMWVAPKFDAPSLDHTQRNRLFEFIRDAAVHTSTEDPAQVAYYQSLKHLVADRQTRTTPGRLLNKFFGPASKNPILTEIQIKDIVERFAVSRVDANRVNFIESDDPDGWVRVYRDGPNSCMQGEDAVRVYARPGNGLRLAYLEDVDGDIIARCIVRDDTEPKQYVRVYPNSDDDHELHYGLRSVLESMGYQHGNLNGAKLELEECDDGYVCPYIDRGNGGSQSGRVGYDGRGGYLQVYPHGDLPLDNTGGYVEDDRDACDDCEERFDGDDIEYSSYLGRQICCNCQENYTRAVSDQYGREEFVPEDEAIYCESNGIYYLAHIAEYFNVYQCAASGDWYKEDELTTCDVGTYEGQQVNDNDVKQDCVTGDVGHEDDFVETPDGWVFEDYVQRCFITGNARHENYLVKVVNPKATLYFDPYEVTLAQLREKFLVCGPLGQRGILVPRGYFGRELDASVYWHTPRNVTEGDDVEVSFDDLVSDLQEEATPWCLAPAVTNEQPEHANV